MRRSCLGATLLAGCAALPAAPDGPPASVRVAVCQIRVSADARKSWRSIERALELAAADGAQIACLPETCLMGWVNPGAHERASTIPGAATERLGRLAREHGLLIVAGLAERAGDCLHDSAVLIDASGELLLTQRKINVLSELMSPPYTPGTVSEIRVAETRFGRIGLLICADTFEPDVVAALAARDPDLVLVPYGWAAPEEAWPDHGRSLRGWVEHTARSVGAPVVGVDAVGALGFGPWAGHVLGGQSVVCDASGAVLGVLADREVEVRTFELAQSGARP